MRNNVYEKIKNGKMSINKSINIILDELLEYNNYEYINSLFDKYKYNYLYESFVDIMHIYLDDFGFSFRSCQQWYFQINDEIINDEDLSQIFDFLEHVINLIGIHYSEPCFDRVLTVIYKLVESLGYKYDDYEGMVVIVENDPIVENVVTKLENSNARKSIYEFLIARRKGNLNEQKKALKTLSEPVETIVKRCRKNYSGEVKNIFSNISEILQCIRHDQEVKEKEFPFYYENSKKWYDITFDQFLFVLGFEQIINQQKDFKQGDKGINSDDNI